MENDILSAIAQLLDNRLGSVSDYVDTQGACFILGVSKSTLYKLNLRKAIPYYRPNGSKKIYFKLADLESYITQNRLMSQAEIDNEATKFLNKEGQNYV